MMRRPIRWLSTSLAMAQQTMVISHAKAPQTCTVLLLCQLYLHHAHPTGQVVPLSVHTLTTFPSACIASPRILIRSLELYSMDLTM